MLEDGMVMYDAFYSWCRSCQGEAHNWLDPGGSGMTALPQQAKPPSTTQRRSIGEIVRYFLRLGTLGFGGPVALVGLMEKELVQDRGWLTNSSRSPAIQLGSKVCPRS